MSNRKGTDMDRRQFNRMMVGGALAALAPMGVVRAAEGMGRKRPNILIIMGDDATYSELPLYGGVNVKTPKIDKLASQGMVFNRAFVTMSMCQPCRAELHTGQQPGRNGCCWNHSPVRPGTRSTVHYLSELGYRVGLAGKVHLQPRRAFPFEMVKGLDDNCVKPSPEFSVGGLREFMARDKEEPFCLVAALVASHVPWTEGEPEHFPVESQKLPPYFADTEATRRDYAKYLAEIEVLDEQVGEILATLEEVGAAEDTLVLFTSEQGAQWPGAKWTNWQEGVHTGMIVRWPGRVKAGVRTDAMVQYADYLPMLIEAAGGTVDEKAFDGRSFLEVLEGKRDTHRKYAYFMHNNVPEGPSYPIRSVTDGKYHYIRNLSPERIYIEKHMMGSMSEWHEYWPAWVFATEADPHAYEVMERFVRRPAEQLYVMTNDRFEMENLADDPAYAEVKARLSAALDTWMEEQGDPGAALDTHEVLEARWVEARRWQSEWREEK